MKHPLALLSAVALSGLFGIAQAQTPSPAASAAAPDLVMKIDASKVTANVSPTLYGLMTEEINYSYDGGIYAELIRNRTFQETSNNLEDPVHWSVVHDGGSVAKIAIDRTQPLNADLPASLRLDGFTPSATQRVGVANDGFWGIPVRPDTTYNASFYAKAAPGFTGPLKISIESADGKTVYATAEIPKITKAWQQYKAVLKTGKVETTADTRFVISTEKPGTLWLNLVSLFPPTYKDRANGNRKDIMEMLADMNPAFLRLPGGNYLEGDTFETRFNWKKTIGNLDTRPGHQGPWGYRSSDGMGLLEFFNWCEDLKMKPVLAVFAGYALKRDYMPEGPGLKPYVQDALDEIEYATGDKSTKWGAVRAKNGHPEPFKIDYIEIGNEDWFDKSGSYEGRYAQFYDAIKSKYPKLQLIATTKVSSRRPDMIDEHYYLSAAKMFNGVHRYDKYDRKGPKIFVGEWATREGAPTPNMNAALGDGAWMTGMERNSDVVLISSYAPLFVNVNKGGMQWKTDLIGYDALTSYGSPSYYAQQIFSKNHGDVVVDAKLENEPELGFAYSVTHDTKTGTLFVKMVNEGPTAQTVKIDLAGVASVAPEGESIVLSSASPTDTNTLTDPKKIVPVTSKLTGLSTNFSQTFAPYSITILKLQTK